MIGSRALTLLLQLPRVGLSVPDIHSGESRDRKFVSGERVLKTVAQLQKLKTTGTVAKSPDVTVLDAIKLLAEKSVGAGSP